MMVQDAKRDGVKFTIQGDDWKPKMRRRRHYLATFLSWVTLAFEYVEVCALVVPLGFERNGEHYKAAYKLALAAVGLEVSDLLCSVSDHEGAVRKGLRLLGSPSVGCGCHAIQLGPKHVLPQFGNPQSRRLRRKLQMLLAEMVMVRVPVGAAGHRSIRTYPTLTTTKMRRQWHLLLNQQPVPKIVP